MSLIKTNIVRPVLAGKGLIQFLTDESKKIVKPNFSARKRFKFSPPKAQNIYLAPGEIESQNFSANPFNEIISGF
jgi:hypothetical protein